MAREFEIGPVLRPQRRNSTRRMHAAVSQACTNQWGPFALGYRRYTGPEGRDPAAGACLVNFSPHKRARFRSQLGAISLLTMRRFRATANAETEIKKPGADIFRPGDVCEAQ